MIYVYHLPNRIAVCDFGSEHFQHNLGNALHVYDSEKVVNPLSVLSWQEISRSTTHALSALPIFQIFCNSPSS